MFQEVKNARQIEGESLRRWFTDDYFDLIVHYDRSNAISGFELCYGKPANEHVLLWDTSSGYKHFVVDDGEGDPAQYKSTPIYLPDGSVNKKYLLNLFLQESGLLEPDLQSFIIRKVEEFTASA